jgi:flagellar motor protein MotB
VPADAFAFGELDEETNAWPAFVDLLAATALLFVMLVGVFIYVGKAERDALQTRLTQVVAALRRDQSSRANVAYVIEQDAQFVRIILKERATFPQGVFTWDSLRPEGKVVLKQLGGVLRAQSVDTLYRQIIVLGHSDQDPYPGDTYSNWELSASRAAVVARYLVDQVGLDPCKVSASGVGPYYPRYGKDKEANRRIEIQIVPAPARGAVRDSTCDSAGDGSRSKYATR